MADFDMWGPAASGPRLVDFDRLKATQMLGEIAMQPVDMELKKAHTELYGAQAKEAQAKIAAAKAQQEALARLAQGQDQGPSQDPIDQMYSVANAILPTDPKTASLVANRASEMGYRRVQADTQKLRQSKLTQEMQAAQFDLSSREIGLTTDEASLERALINFEQRTKIPSGLIDPMTNKMYPGIRFSMGTRDMMAGKLMPVKDQITVARQTQHEANLENEWKSRQENRAFWQSFENLRARADATRAPVRDKAGAKGPTATDLRVGSDLLKSEFPSIGNEEANALGAELVDRARQIRDANPALRGDEARTAALNKMKEEGKFQGQRGNGRTPQSAIPLPQDRKRVQANTWYITPNGVRFWDGKQALTDQQYRLRGAGMPAQGLAPESKEDDNDDEED